VETYAVNVMGLVHLLYALRRTDSMLVVVNLTSDKCYENREWFRAYREDEPMGGYDPYSSLKGCTELVTAAWRWSLFAGESAAALASARADNVIGDDWAEDRIVPDCVRAFSAGKPLVLRNPGAVRPWQHVVDPLCGYLLLAERLFAGGAYTESWNFGPLEANTQPVNYIVEKLARYWDAATWRIADGKQPHEAVHLKIYASKAQVRLGWYPRLATDLVLDRTAAWYRRQQDGASARDLCLDQILRYQKQDGR
jgi:CDP-glucose 4,6-dehydratase